MPLRNKVLLLVAFVHLCLSMPYSKLSISCSSRKLITIDFQRFVIFELQAWSHFECVHNWRKWPISSDQISISYSKCLQQWDKMCRNFFQHGVVLHFIGVSLHPKMLWKRVLFSSLNSAKCNVYEAHVCVLFCFYVISLALNPHPMCRCRCVCVLMLSLKMACSYKMIKWLCVHILADHCWLSCLFCVACCHFKQLRVRARAKETVNGNRR